MDRFTSGGCWRYRPLDYLKFARLSQVSDVIFPLAVLKGGGGKRK